MELDQELATFQKELPKLLAAHKGEYALVKGERVDSFWLTEDEAFDAGCARFGVEPFLVKKVEEKEEPIQTVVDLNPPCRS
jgi:hypothetical protein